MVSLHEEDDHVIEDERKEKAQKADTCQNHKSHMPLVRCEMVAVHCFVWLLALLL